MAIFGGPASGAPLSEIGQVAMWEGAFSAMPQKLWNSFLMDTCLSPSVDIFCQLMKAIFCFVLHSLNVPFFLPNVSIVFRSSLSGRRQESFIWFWS